MRVGVNLGHRVQRDGKGLRNLARCVDQLGYDALWTSEHIVMPAEFTSPYSYTANGRPSFDVTGSFAAAMVTLAHVAAVTEHVRLGTGVIPMFAHNPVALAKDAASVDRQSNGRLELGVGAGWLSEEAHILGNPTDHRGARLEEAITIMQKAWRHAPFSHTGRFWKIPPSYVRPEPIQSPGIPLWIGGSGPARLRTALATGAKGVFLASAEGGRVAAVRAQLPSENEIGIFLNIECDFDTAETEARIGQLKTAGADLVVLSVNRYEDEPADTIRSVERFAAELLEPSRA